MKTFHTFQLAKITLTQSITEKLPFTDSYFILAFYKLYEAGLRSCLPPQVLHINADELIALKKMFNLTSQFNVATWDCHMHMISQTLLENSCIPRGHKHSVLLR
jgi:hypothetical protein